MPKFTYISRDEQGQRVTAVAEAENRQGLLTQLKERGLTVVEVKEVGGKQEAESKKQSKLASFLKMPVRSIGTSELATFWREFATMIGAGLPIVDALQSITEEMEHAGFRRVLKDVTACIWEGFNLSDSLKKHPQVFSPMVVALIGAAEESGSLPQVSNQLATFLENRDRLIRKVQAALTYPFFLTGFFFVVLAVATFWIIPKFRDIYASFDAKLPWLTERVFAVNAFILQNFAWLTAITAALVLALVLWFRKPSGREVMDRIILRLPVFGKLLQRASIARFSRSLSILLLGGIPINRALEMAQETCGNRVIAKAVQSAREEILKGSKIAVSLRREPIFPRMAVRMISAGEESGNLSALLEKIADFFEARVDAALSTINALIEPIFIIVIGIFVLVFILSLYLPIFSLAMSVKG